jgi:hypothetical protein
VEDVNEHGGHNIAVKITPGGSSKQIDCEPLESQLS